MSLTPSEFTAEVEARPELAHGAEFCVGCERWFLVGDHNGAELRAGWELCGDCALSRAEFDPREERL